MEALEGLQRAIEANGHAAAGDVDAAFQRVLAADLLLRERFSSVRSRLEEVDASTLVWDRLDAAQARYEEAATELLQPLTAALVSGEKGSPSRAADLSSVVDSLRGPLREAFAGASSPILRSELPHGPASLTARTPPSGPSIAPSYLDATDPQPEGRDLAGTAEAPLSAEIVARAEALEFDAVSVFEFVRNEMTTEYYAGSLKGAEETLRQRAGNDVDQASLLIALLRASSIPARYVHGTVERSVDDMAESLGLDDVSAVPAALARAGVAYRAIIRGGRLDAVEVEATWVAAHVPYSNYRGAVVDFSGRTWVPLAPSIKSVERVTPQGVLREMGLSVDAALDQLLAAPQPETPLSWLRRQVEAHLVDVAPDESYEDQLGSTAVRPEQIGLLPSTLPVPVLSVLTESARLDPERTQTVRFLMRSGLEEDDPVILDLTLPVRDVANRRVTLSYSPATVDDHTTVNAFGGLDRVPAYLVTLRPRVMVGGRLRAVGEGSLAMGAAHRVELVVAGPWGSERVASTWTAGSYQAVAIGAQHFQPHPDLGDDPTDGETAAARLLSQVASTYGERWDDAEEQLAALLATELVRPIPSVVFAANSVRVDSALGLPVSLVWQGVTLDAALRIVEPLAPAADSAAARDFLRLSGLHGSALEHVVFEDVFQVGSISADKGLGLARASGSTVVRIDATNVDSVLPSLAHPPAVIDDVENRVRLGQVVEIPQAPLGYNAWSGSVWRAEDPASGASAYLISGGLAGGATSVAPDNWILDFLADALASPYSSAPNADPLSAAQVRKVLSSDAQEGIVDDWLPVELAVTVRDIAGRPVQGAAVTFVSHSGGGKLTGPEGEEIEEVVFETDFQGIASVVLRLGTDTSLDPIYVHQAEDDEYPSQALLHLVDVSVATHGGLIGLDEPFTAIGFPAEPKSLRRANEPQGPQRVHAGAWSDTLIVLAEDRFGNPVSNVPVDFEVKPAGPQDPNCINLADTFEPSVVFDGRPDATGPAACSIEVPLLGECGVPAFRSLTSHRGAFAGYIAGSSTTSVTGVEMSSPRVDEEPLSTNYHVAYTTFADGTCAPLSVRRLISPTPFFGGNATRAGQEFAGPVGGRLVSWEQDFTFYPQDDIVSSRERYLDTGKWGFLQPDQAGLLVSNGGLATSLVGVGPSTLEGTVTTGPVPGLNEVTLRVEGWRTWEGLYLDAIGDEPAVTEYSWLYSPAHSGWVESFGAESVWGVLPTFESITPSPLVLNEQGRTEGEITLSYTIEPTDYTAGEVEIQLYEEGELVGLIQGSDHEGTGTATIQKGFAIDLEKDYEVELVLNRGGVSEVVSDREPLP
ncbi:MAG: hypothetical protein MPN21_12340, partial [Thermoanaerobaculia bacterium]|nr:hypothetical protein [Thermoanaerobaculia bacterium]